MHGGRRVRRLIIVGAGPFGRELASWLKTGEGQLSDCTAGGFLEDDPHALDAYPAYRPGVIGSITDYQPQPDDILAMAIADPRTKLHLADQLLARGGRFLTFVHPTAVCGDHVRLGTGVIVCPYAVISCHTTLGDFVTVNLTCTIGHDVTLGRGCTLSAHVDLTGFVSADEGAFFGSHASVLPKVHVGAFAKVGAGSVAVRHVPAGTTVMGVPAKRISPA